MDALQVALNVAWYNTMPALPAHSYLMLKYILKILRRHIDKVAAINYFYKFLIVLCCIESTQRVMHVYPRLRASASPRLRVFRRVADPLTNIAVACNTSTLHNHIL